MSPKTSFPDANVDCQASCLSLSGSSISHKVRTAGRASPQALSEAGVRVHGAGSGVAGVVGRVVAEQQPQAGRRQPEAQQQAGHGQRVARVAVVEPPRRRGDHDGVIQGRRACRQQQQQQQRQP